MTKISHRGTSETRINLDYLRIVGMLLIFGAALAIRLYPILVTPEPIRNGFGPFGDSYLYHKIAYNLYKGHGYSGIDNGSAFGRPMTDKIVDFEPAISRGPVYPVFLASLYCLWADGTATESRNRWQVNWDIVRIVQSILDAIICLLLFWLVRVLYPDRYLPAFLAAVLYGASFYNVFYTRMLLSESITTFLVVVVIISGIIALKSRRTVCWLIFGAGCGLVSLSRPEYILYPFFMVGIIFLLQRHAIWGAVKTSTAIVCGLGLVIAPWALRNYMTYKQLIPTSVGAMGLNLFNGTYENGDWQGWGKYPDKIFKSPEMKKEVIAWDRKLGFHLTRGTIGLKDYDLRFKRLALNTIRDNPLNCFMVWIQRLPRLWYQNYIQMYVYREPSGIWFIGYAIFSLTALFLMKPEIRIACLPIFLLFLYMNLVYLPFHIEPRYGVTIYPGLIVLTAIGLYLSGSKVWARVQSIQGKTDPKE
ncbi:hypothetical protein D1BOALGB6SA_6091 [Olavius sp. associated proteobacterium Delta 1]|nr:hypothetical protein D1BOALGB6SA_6091 [Olavius sp. associated proteobacterium Delta 1]